MSKYFIDTEFIEDFTRPLIGKPRHYIDLISIAIVAEDGREFYAVSKEFSIDYVWNKFQMKESPYVSLNTGTGTMVKEYWLRDNVLMPIFYELAMKEWGINEGVSLAAFKADQIWSADVWWFKYLIRKYGKSNKQIAKEIRHFIAGRNVDANKEQWILDYDTKNIQFYGWYSAYDHVLLCSLYGRMLDLPKGFPMYTRDLKQMLDEKAYGAFPQYTSPSAYVKEVPGYPGQTNSHNALDDARWNKKLYDFLKTV